MGDAGPPVTRNRFQLSDPLATYAVPSCDGASAGGSRRRVGGPPAVEGNMGTAMSAQGSNGRTRIDGRRRAGRVCRLIPGRCIRRIAHDARGGQREGGQERQGNPGTKSWLLGEAGSTGRLLPCACPDALSPRGHRRCMALLVRGSKALRASEPAWHPNEIAMGREQLAAAFPLVFLTGPDRIREVKGTHRAGGLVVMTSPLQGEYRRFESDSAHGRLAARRPVFHNDSLPP